MRVLVVEDVHALADDIAEGLRDEGFAVDIAYNGLDAAAKLDANAYQVVVLDRDLPGIHGDTLCRMITESDRPAMTLMLTAAGSTDDRISGLGLGADDYLAKPFHFTELVLRIRALARRQPTARPRVYHAADLALDPQRHAATRNGRPLDLSVKEFGVLEALLRAAPAFLSTEELLEQVWDENADPFTNAVFNTLSRLRRKLGNPPLIETQPGVGYRITDRSARPLPGTHLPHRNRTPPRRNSRPAPRPGPAHPRHQNRHRRTPPRAGPEPGPQLSARRPPAPLAAALVQSPREGRSPCRTEHAGPGSGSRKPAACPCGQLVSHPPRRACPAAR